jgi:protein-tyrosine phosphatase
MPNILIVCTANICRSPVVEAFVRDRLEKKESGKWAVASAGTWASNGNHASPYSIELMAERDLEITHHRSQPVSEKLLSESDLVLCLATGHVEALKAEFPKYAAKIYLLTEMSGSVYSVHDPYGEPRPAYERMVAEVSDLVDEGFARLTELARQNESRRLRS